VSHPEHGVSLAARIVVMEAARGSSSSSSVLAESVRSGVNPAGFILALPDPILLIGSLVAAELYGICVPIVVVTPEHWPRLARARWARIRATPNKASVYCSQATLPAKATPSCCPTASTQ
jgi:predicted aconitase with swiveling domain